MIQTIDRMLVLLEGMNAPASQNWETAWQVYDYVLRRWPLDLAGRVVDRALMTCRWRPSVAELREIAAKLESPKPTVDEALDEVLTLITRFGAFGKRDPDNPHCYLAGPPEFSHPLVAAVVRRVGDWEAICAGDSQHQSGGLHGAFREAYGRSAQDWESQVQACLDSGTRPVALFPVYKPFSPAQLTSSALASALPAVPRLAIPSAPTSPIGEPRNRVAEIRDLIGTLQAKSDAAFDTPEYLAKVEDNRRRFVSQARFLIALEASQDNQPQEPAN